MSPTEVVSPADRANQRNAVLAGFLGWTLDAFDFFILTLVIEDVAHAFFPGSPLKSAAADRAGDHADAGDAADRRDRVRPDGRSLRPAAAADAERRSSTR